MWGWGVCCVGVGGIGGIGGIGGGCMVCEGEGRSTASN